jgi:hypothetical protein
MSQLRVGGSTAERIINCHGSSALCAVAPPQPESDEAREGTVAHRLAELCLREGLDPDDMVGRFVLDVEIDPEMADAVSVYTNHVRSRFTKDNQTDLVGAAGLHVESLIDLTSIDPLCEGKCDAWSFDVNEGLLDVDDFKFGAGVAVEVRDNKQLSYYALGAMIAAGSGVELIRLNVIQPNAEHPEGPIRTTTVRPYELIEFGLELKHAIDESRKPNAPLNDGPWCQFCDASGFCPKLYQGAKQALELEAQDATIADLGGCLEPDEVGRRLTMIPQLRFWISGTLRYAWGEAQRGRIPTGSKLVRIRGKRRWKDNPELAMRQASRAFNIPEDNLFKRRAITPKRLEDMVGKAKAKDFLAAYAVKNDRAVALVPITDRRDAVDPNITHEFADIISEMQNGDQE